ncbi:MAG: hypothetical protein ACK45H_05240 [Bacteroidota bacterium]|jgi:hypothetical protein
MLKNKPALINWIFLLFSGGLLLFSFWKTVMQSDLIPYLPILIGSALSFLLFLALIVAAWRSPYAIIWTILALATSGISFLYYFYPATLKELYPLQIWLTITILIASLQNALDRKGKRFHLQMRFANYGLILLLIPAVMLKAGAPWIWSLFSLITLPIMALNLILFLLPTNSGHSR